MERAFFGSGFLVPRNEIAANDLIGEAAGSVEVELDGLFLGVDVFEDELVEEVVVFRG